MDPYSTLPILLTILFLGLLLPDLFSRFKLPFVSFLILLGALLGPNGLHYIETNETIALFGFLGSAFLMLLAGLEVKAEHLTLDTKTTYLAGMNFALPFITGYSIAKAFGYTQLPCLMLGTILASSSVTLATAALRNRHLLHSEAGKLMQKAIILEDALSLILLSFILQSVRPITEFPLPIYIGILISSIIILRMFLPEVAKYYLRRLPKKDDDEARLRFVLAALIAVLLYFSGLGVHPILASFLVGALLAESIASTQLYSKIHTLGYGLFIPVFFFIAGMEMDLSQLARFSPSNLLLLSIVAGSILSKSISGYLAGKHIGLTKKQSALFGTASTAQLTTTLAVTYAASTLGILDGALTTAIVFLSMTTSLLMPIIFEYSARS